MSEARAFAFRERAKQAHKKAMRAGIPEENETSLADRRAGLDQDGRAGRVKRRHVLVGQRGP